ncbi:MAG: aquaporin [Lachnospiraceae bacterium]|nr:aquaporin [Lachnospiraceae bacterium]
MKKYIAEFLGTYALVFFGCGTAMAVGCDAVFGAGYLITALAFGLTIVGMAYCVGNISGCHINPAVSLAVYLTGGMKVVDFCCYVVAQVLGAFAAAASLSAIFDLGDVTDRTGGLGTNGLAGLNGNSTAAIIVEIIMTFFFVSVILGVTSKKAGHGSFGGLIIGLTLTWVHLIGIAFTGCSVNPARSLGPAVMTAIKGDTAAIKDVWVFILAPLIGAAAAALFHIFFEGEEKKEEVKEETEEKATEAEA